MTDLLNAEELLRQLTRIVTVGGRNRRAADELSAILPSGEFDAVETDRAGNIILTRKCAREGAKTLCFDAHFDQIGMLVRSIEADGFVGVVNAGGLDGRTLPAQTVVIHGKKQIRGVIVSTPPHLRRHSDGDSLTPIEDILIDTGYPEDELRELISVGDPISFEFKFGQLENDRVFGAGFDNKSCAAAAILAALSCRRDEMAFDLSILLAASEEMGGFSGAVAGYEEIRPDATVVLDVEFADCEGAIYPLLPKIGEGPVIAHSALCDRHLTAYTVSLAKKNGIPHSTMAWGRSLGTDGDIASTSACGISTVSVSLPLTSMHTCVESVSLRDLLSLSKLLSTLLCTEDLLEHTVIGRAALEEVSYE